MGQEAGPVSFNVEQPLIGQWIHNAIYMPVSKYGSALKKDENKEAS